MWVEQPENDPTALAVLPYPRAHIQPVLKKLPLFKWPLWKWPKSFFRKPIPFAQKIHSTNVTCAEKLKKKSSSGESARIFLYKHSVPEGVKYKLSVCLYIFIARKCLGKRVIFVSPYVCAQVTPQNYERTHTPKRGKTSIFWQSKHTSERTTFICLLPSVLLSVWAVWTPRNMVLFCVGRVHIYIYNYIYYTHKECPNTPMKFESLSFAKCKTQIGQFSHPSPSSPFFLLHISISVYVSVYMRRSISCMQIHMHMYTCIIAIHANTYAYVYMYNWTYYTYSQKLMSSYTSANLGFIFVQFASGKLAFFWFPLSPQAPVPHLSFSHWHVRVCVCIYTWMHIMHTICTYLYMYVHA